MSVQYIIGNSRINKSTYIYAQIIDMSIKNQDKNYVVIVPEQITLETQKELVHLHPNHVIMNVDVLSFNRLAYRVFDELGTKLNDVLEETGKSLLVKKLALDLKDELSVLAPNINKKGYISEVKSLISELAQYNIDSDEFKSIIDNNDVSNNFRNKAVDICTIYKAYEEYIKDRYITSESILVKLNEVISDSKIIKDTVFVFDGFTGFTPLQNEILRTILPIVDKAYITVTLDNREEIFGDFKEYELFYMSKKMISKTNAICKSLNIDIDNPVLLDELFETEEDELSFLQENIFRNNNVSFDKDKNDQIEIYALDNPRKELEFVASNIAREVRENNRQYKDFAICTANLNEYQNIIERIFKEYNIPVFVDKKSEVIFNPLIEFIESVFNIVLYDFSYESVMHLLKTNLTPLNLYEMDLFDTYLIATGIRGVNKYRDHFDIETKQNKGQLSDINKIREKFVEPILKFHDSINNNNLTAKEISVSLYELFEEYLIEDKLKRKSLELKSKDEIIKSIEYEQIYKAIISILDKIVDLIGDEIISINEYLEVIKAACEDLKISTIPPLNDAVVLGDIERTRYDKISILYMIGVNDGNIPKSNTGGGILSQNERIKLKDNDVELAPTDKEKAFMQKFYLYMIMSKPSDKLVLTYSLKNLNSESLVESYLIKDVKELFDISDTYINGLCLDDWLVTVDSSKQYIAQLIRDYASDDNIFIGCEEEFDKLIAIIRYIENEGNVSLDEVIDAAFFYNNKETISKSIYEELIGKDEIKGSVSRLEKYGMCHYRFFLDYCIKLRELENNDFEKIDMGNIYHEVLEKFSKELLDRNISWRSLENDVKNEILDKVCEDIYEESTKSLRLDTARERFALFKMKNILSKTIDVLSEQIIAGDFSPKGFEVELSEVCSVKQLRVELDNGKKMHLSGKIDRYDEYDDGNGNVYIKIIDYKSGNKSFDFEEIYNGLQLQLIFYSNTLVEGKKEKTNKNVYPGAVFYYHINNPVIDFEKCDGSVLESIIKKQKPDGLFICNENDSNYDVARALDATCIDGMNSIYAPYKKNLNGKFGVHSHIVTNKEYEVLSNHVNKIVTEYGNQIANGDIEARPLKEKGCMYCSYKGICGFDDSLPGCEYREYTKIDGRNFKSKKEDFLYKIKGDYDA